MTTFEKFAEKVHKTLEKMKKEDLFVVDLEKDFLWDLYLKSFPEGTNPLYKERTEHDCNTCKSFIRNVAGVVTVDGRGNIKTIWDDAAKLDDEYGTVSKALQKAVKKAQISGPYAPGEGSYGVKRSFSQEGETFSHFYSGKLKQFSGTKKSEVQSAFGVLQRGVEEISPSSLSIIKELIEDKQLYRGEEHLDAIKGFEKLQKSLKGKKEALFWAKAMAPYSRFKNTVIGTLAMDLSEGKDLEEAIRAFESKVAPANYKRTSAPISKKMVENAMAKIKELGLESALERRIAKLEDVSVNDVIWASGDASSKMKDGLSDLLMGEVKQTTSKQPAKFVTVDDFIANIVPEAKKIEVQCSNEQLGNLMVLTAPKNGEENKLFQWDNDFAWSYTGGVADSIKQRVKKAGGNVTANYRFSLSWFDTDDLDIHMDTPNGLIYFGNRRECGGHLDVDMNVHAESTEPVENITFDRMVDGKYKVKVNNYTCRNGGNQEFTIEKEEMGRIEHYTYKGPMPTRKTIEVISFEVQRGEIKNLKVLNKDIRSAQISQEKWGIESLKFQNVSFLTVSPNYWGESEVGNKHHFFVLENAETDEPVRGIYNEFLDSRLMAHRKVFEVIGRKTMCPAGPGLCGLGFSSTKEDKLVARVTTEKGTRLYEVGFGKAKCSKKRSETNIDSRRRKAS